MNAYVSLTYEARKNQSVQFGDQEPKKTIQNVLHKHLRLYANKIQLKHDLFRQIGLNLLFSQLKFLITLTEMKII